MTQFCRHSNGRHRLSWRQTLQRELSDYRLNSSMATRTWLLLWLKILLVSLRHWTVLCSRRTWQWVTWRQQRWNGPTSRRQANFRQQAEFDIDHIQVPRTRKPPVRQTGPAPAYQPVNVNQYCSVEYYKLIDIAWICQTEWNETVNQEGTVCYGVLESSEWFH